MVEVGRGTCPAAMQQPGACKGSTAGSRLSRQSPHASSCGVLANPAPILQAQAMPPPPVSPPVILLRISLPLPCCCNVAPGYPATAACLLPPAGSDKFHVQWTGVAEVLGGLGLCLGALPLDFIPAWLSPASAYGLCLLTAIVTPANLYMYTHNAPGPIPENVNTGPIPWQGHLARGLMQVLLLSTLWGIATASS
jgi:uncharacterized membrane protein